MLYECKILGAKLFVLAPSLRWVQQFLKMELLKAGDRTTVPSIREVPITNRELVGLGLGQMTLDKSWGPVEVSPEGQRTIALAARRHRSGESVYWEARGLTQGPHGGHLDRQMDMLKNPLGRTRSKGTRS